MICGVELIKNKMEHEFVDEIWKEVSGFNGMYRISNCGRLESIFTGSPIIREPSLNKGYPSICLRINKKTINKRIHRLVAEAFIPNPDNKKTINHIDGNKQNNHVSNLEWCTQKENVQHAYRIGLSKPNRLEIFKELKINEKEIYRYSIEGDYIDSFPSLLEATIHVNGNNGCISRFANHRGNMTHSYGYKWSYEKRDKF